jgi:hypothetical protein
VVVVAVAFVDVDVAGLDPDRPQRVAVEGIAVQRLGMKHKLTAIAIDGRGRHRHLGAKLIERSGVVTLNNHGVKSLGFA